MVYYKHWYYQCVTVYSVVLLTTQFSGNMKMRGYRLLVSNKILVGENNKRVEQQPVVFI